MEIFITENEHSAKNIVNGKQQDMDDGCDEGQKELVKNYDHDKIRQEMISNEDDKEQENDDYLKQNVEDTDKPAVLKDEEYDREQDMVAVDDLVKGQQNDVNDSITVKEAQHLTDSPNNLQSAKEEIESNNDEPCIINNPKLEDIVDKQGLEMTNEKEISTNEQNPHFPHVEQNVSTKLPVCKEKTDSMSKLREMSKIRRNKQRLVQREQIHTRHRSSLLSSSTKDIAKLLKKKRSVRRSQSSTSQDDDQASYSGTKRKRIPNRPGISFEIGARLEAKDYLDKWYPSKIIAVDEDVAEVLIHFERWSARFDEWMPMESPRLRAITHPSTRNEQKEKTNKMMPQYKAGEEVLARWTDCKMYPAKVLEVGANNFYQVLFYDGFQRTVQSLNIEKLPREMAGKADFPSASNPESPERKKPTCVIKESSKLPSKKMDKSPKERIGKRDQNDLMSILGKKKRLIVGGIFQAKRNKVGSEKCNSISRHKSNEDFSSVKESSMDIAEPCSMEEIAAPASPVGYIDGRKIARKEFIIEEDHNHFKCPILSCGKSFRKDKLLQSHMKHYHGDSRNREKKKSSLLVQDLKTIVDAPSVPVSPTCEKAVEGKETKPEVKTKILVKDEISTDLPKSANTQPISPKATSKPNTQESFKPGKMLKSPKTDVKHNKTNSVPEVGLSTENTNVGRVESRVTRSEKVPKSEQKTLKTDSKSTRAETRSSKLEIKSPKTDNKVIKTESRITKAESKTNKIENKVIKTENKVIKSENKTTRNEIKPIKNESKAIKSEIKPIDEKLEKCKILQENKSAEENETLPVVEEAKIVDSGISVMSPSQVPVSPVENAHTSRSKKRRSTSASEVHTDTSVNDNQMHLMTPKEADIKLEQKVIDVENIQDDVKPMITDFKSSIQEDDAEEGQSDEIVHCICNCIEENGLMMQCEVCLAWQHGACFDIDDVKDVPDKYVCYACLKPEGLRESFRYRHDLDWFNKGEMTTFSFLSEKPSPNVVSETLSAHDLVASLHNVMLVLHSLQMKLKIAKDDNHPDLVMWKKPWMDYSFLHNVEINEDELVQSTRVDFDHSYFSTKDDLLATTNALNTRISSYDKITKREDCASSMPEGETSHSTDRKVTANDAKSKSLDKERTYSKQQSSDKSEFKESDAFDPSICRKNLLDHLIQMQHAVEQQLIIIEEHLQLLESEMGLSALTEKELQKEMGASLKSIRKLLKDLSFVQQLTNFQ